MTQYTQTMESYSIPLYETEILDIKVISLTKTFSKTYGPKCFK